MNVHVKQLDRSGVGRIPVEARFSRGWLPGREVITHGELMQLGGIYADLFSTQAASYQESMG